MHSYSSINPFSDKTRHLTLCFHFNYKIIYDSYGHSHNIQNCTTIETSLNEGK